jgi:diguanylate cyclase (GGDEF)-like protein/PAS domain S-box-containing protein
MVDDAQRLRMLESVLDAANQGMVVLDHARKVVAWNRWMVRHSSIQPGDAAGRDFFDVFQSLDSKRIESAVGQALKGFPSVLSQTLHKAPLPLALTPGGERIQQAIAVTPIDIQGMERHCLIQVSDVSAAVSRERLLREQAIELRSQTFSDGLTGIANRRAFDVAMEKEIRRAKRAHSPLSLLMLDIDYFKAYNDHYGHQQGDACLVRVAAELASMLQRPLDLIARYGGEEFAVVLPEMDEEHSRAMGEAMRTRVESLQLTHMHAGEKQHVTISVGVATLTTTQAADIHALIGAADRALYEAKRQGRNRVCIAAI